MASSSTTLIIRVMNRLWFYCPDLTANARCFDGLIQAGLSPRFRVLALDLRGRGLSDKPATGYAMADHAADVIGLLDSLGINQTVMCGHSFGGMLTFYLAANYPERVAKLVALDASSGLINKNSRALIKPSLDRLGKTVPSWELYVKVMKSAPFFYEWWDPTIESYFRADAEIREDGTVRPRSQTGEHRGSYGQSGTGELERSRRPHTPASATASRARPLWPSRHAANRALGTGPGYDRRTLELSLCRSARQSPDDAVRRRRASHR